jgi:tetratricopeptide (TPR) repeat protein
MELQAQEKPLQPFPDPILKPAVPVPAPVGPELELPQQEGFPTDVNSYENPLLLFRGERRELPMADEPNPDLLPPVSPYRPREANAEEPADRPLTPEELKLRTLGSKVAASVVSLRVWDEFGGQIAAGVGTIVTKSGVILTDTGLLHPEIAGRVDYITATGADGSNHQVAGFYVADLTTGVTLLQSGNTAETIPLPLTAGQRFNAERPCHVLAVSEKRGLVLADARVQMDPALTGLGWLNLRGKDSPGAVGSPVLADDGSVIAMVGMKVPLKSWMNFALPCDAAASELRKKQPPLLSLKALPKTPKLREVSQDPEFIAAFEILQQRRLEPAMRQWLRLAQKYPRSAECWALLGLCASHLGAAVEAVNCQRKAVSLDPKAGLYWHQLAIAKLRETPGKTPPTGEDREALELAVEQRPSDKLAWLLLASRYVRDNDLGKADEALHRVTMMAPDYAQGFYLHAYVRGRLRDYSGAQQSIQQSLKLNPGSPEAWFYQGLLLDKQGAHDEAAKAYRNTVRLRPTHSKAWLNLAHAYKKANRPTEARQTFLEYQKHMK